MVGLVGPGEELADRGLVALPHAAVLERVAHAGRRELLHQHANSRDAVLACEVGPKLLQGLPLAHELAQLVEKLAGGELWVGRGGPDLPGGGEH